MCDLSFFCVLSVRRNWQVNPNLSGRGGRAGNFIPLPPCCFSLNNSETVKAVTLVFPAFSNILLERFVPNFSQSPDNGQNSDGVISDFRISDQSLIKRICHNSRTSDGIDIKLGPVTKLDKRNKMTSKNLMMTLCRKIVTLSTFFQFIADLEQFGSRISEALSVKLIFSLTVTFYLTKTENRTKKSLTHLSHYCFE